MTGVVPVEQGAQRSEFASDLRRIVCERCHAHEATNFRVLQRSAFDGVQDGVQLGFRHAVLLRLLCDVQLKQNTGSQAGVFASLIDFSEQPIAVHGMDQVGVPDGLFDFAGL